MKKIAVKMLILIVIISTLASYCFAASWVDQGNVWARNKKLISAKTTKELLKELFAERISSTILHIPNDENYNATYEICNAAEPIETKKLLKKKPKNNPKGRWIPALFRGLIYLPA